MALKGFPFDEDSIDVRLVGSRFRDGRHANARDFQLWPFQKEVKNKQSYLIAGCVLLVLGLIVFGVLSYYIFRPEKMLEG